MSACPAVPCEICDSNSAAHFTGVGPADRTGAGKIFVFLDLKQNLIFFKSLNILGGVYHGSLSDQDKVNKKFDLFSGCKYSIRGSCQTCSDEKRESNLRISTGRILNQKRFY